MNQPQHIIRSPELSERDRKRWDKRFAALIIALFLWRLFYVTTVPLDLAPDEAYYWDWSRHLDWGYCSKPPMVAWIIALFTGFFGSTAFVVRLPTVFLGVVGLCSLYALGRRLYESKVAFWTALAATATPGSCALSLIMTIDALLMCFWALALYTLWRALENQEDRSHWWSLTVLAVGLGVLSKQIMLVFLPLLPLFLWLSPKDTPLLRQTWPYTFFTLSLLALVPVLWWNFQHDWITFHHTGHHFSIERNGFPFSASTFLNLVGSQLGVLSPVTWILLAGVSGISLCRLARQSRPQRYLLVFSAVVLAGFLFLSLLQGVNANWPAPFYLASFVLLAAWGVGHVSCGPHFDRWRFLFRPGVAVGAGFAVLIYILPFLLPVSPLGGGGLDPTARLRGWRELGQQVGAIWQSLPEKERCFLMSTKRQVVSELAFYVPGQPRVFHWPPCKGARRSQYEVWPGPVDKIGWDSLIVIEVNRNLPQGIFAAFETVEPAGELTIHLGHAGNRQFLLYQGHFLRSWPRDS